MPDMLYQEKRKTLESFLEKGTVMVYLDSRYEGVEVPKNLQNDPELRLNFSYAFRIPDFVLSDDAIIATLSFARKPYRCVIPWGAIWRMAHHTTGQNAIFFPSIPEEIWESPPEDLEKMFASLAESTQEIKSEPEKQSEKQPILAEVKEPPEDDEPKTTSPPKRGHLRLVK